MILIYKLNLLSFSAYSTYTNPLLTAGSVATNMRKPYDDLDLIVGGRYGPRPLTPTSPITVGNWGLDNYSNLDGVNPTFMHVQQPHTRLGALDLESKKLFQSLQLLIKSTVFHKTKLSATHFLRLSAFSFSGWEHNFKHKSTKKLIRNSV